MRKINHEYDCQQQIPMRTMDARIFYFYLALSIFDAASSGETAEKSA
jgi:hypothetical protein